jgi:hypothetical protein
LYFGAFAGVAIEAGLLGCLPGGANNNFAKGIPGTAIVALSLPFTVVSTAIVTDVGYFAFCHILGFATVV